MSGTSIIAQIFVPLNLFYMFQGVNLPDGKYVIPTSVSRMVMRQPFKSFQAGLFCMVYCGLQIFI